MVRSEITQSFVARIWLERTADEVSQWRGHIQHIQGPEEIYFQDLTELSEFMELVSGIPAIGFGTGAGKVVSITRPRPAPENKPKPEK